MSAIRSARTKSNTAAASLVPSRLEIIALGAVVLIYGLFLAEPDDAVLDDVNMIGSFSLLVILWAAAWRMLQLDSMNIWSALFWFRVSTGVYYGFGSLTLFLINDESRNYFDSLYAFSNSEMTKTNMINAFGILVVLVTSYFVARLARSINPDAGTVRTDAAHIGRLEAVRGLGLAFLMIGGVLKYSVIFPHAMGWTTTILPGALNSFGALTFAGIYLLTFWSLSRSRLAFVAISLFVLVEMAAGLLLLTKEETMLPMLVFVLAVLSHRLTMFRVFTSTITMLLLFNFLVPLVSYGRQEYHKELVYSGTVGIGERLDILASFDGTATGSGTQDELQGSLLRFSYVNAGAFAIHRYDSGNPGTSLRNILAVLIPRFLWPDKPVLALGLEFRELIRGVDATGSISAGLFAEAYWNFGWLGIPILMIPMGVILTYLSRYALKVARSGDWLYMPVLFLAMRVGLASSGHFVATIAGATVIIIWMHFIIKGAKRVLDNARRRSRIAV